MKALKRLLLKHASGELSTNDIQPLILDLFRFTKTICEAKEGHWCAGCKEKCREYYLSPIPKEGEFILEFCEKCLQMTNHLDNVCQKCKLKNAEQ